MSRALDLRAAEFHRRNPHVMEEIRRLALNAVQHGRRRLSINQLFEVVRYDHGIATNGGEFRLNNSYRAWFARELMATTPQLQGMFEIRGGGSSGIADGMASSFPDDTGDGEAWWDSAAYKGHAA